MGGFDWSKATVIDQDSLGEYVYEVDTDEVDNIHLTNYCVQVQPAGFAFDGLGKFLRNRFAYYVFSKKEVERLRKSGKSPSIKAQEMAGIGKQFRQDGTLGEFLLFLLTDGFLDIPMISHKISNKQSYSHEVYGCDNLFFGEFKDEECIGIGEAKVYGNITDGIREAVSSISEFHEEQSKTYLTQELNVAPKNLTNNLEPEQFDYLAEVLVSDPGQYPILHPVFICYEDGDLGSVEDVTKDNEKIREEIKSRLEDIDPLSKTQTQVGNGTDRLRRAYLLFLFLPVPSLDDFRERMLVSIDPGLRHLFDREADADEKSEAEEGSA
ncbi:DUF1837 domain-containing protein [Halostella sp. PRR32]|uniref:HamA C-terminal domain-containing protein n=1 Tax=Halostella sp. PRR32 TaxID=3098147 RepID=UPI00110EA7EA|nr:DUF1837 domain-containing protein [Halostella sp. PRR32]